MKNIIYIASILFLLGCNNEDAGDCFQTAGNIKQIEIAVPQFDKITVHQRIELIITQGDAQKVIIESGENLLSDITAEVIDNELILKDYNSCNLFRDYDLTKVHITSPNLTTIRNASEYDISSNGVLTYPNLYLRSSGEEFEYLPVGDWHLNIQNESVKIWANGVAVFYLNGSTSNLDISFSDQDCRFEGENFIVNHIKVRNVSSNDMLVFPVESLTGSIHSTGSVISYNKPPIIDVDVQSIGQLIFK